MIKETSQVSTRTSRAQRLLCAESTGNFTVTKTFDWQLSGLPPLWSSNLNNQEILHCDFLRKVQLFVFKILIYVNGWLCTCREMFTWLFDTIGGNDSTSSDPWAQIQMGNEYLRSIRKTCVVKLVWTGTKNTVYGLYLCLRLSGEIISFSAEMSCQRVG